MCKAVEEYAERYAKEYALEYGKECEEKGKLEGKLETKIAVVKNMLDRNMPIETALEIAGLDRQTYEKFS